MSDRLHCPGCGIPTIEGGLDTTEEELYCNRCVEELERNMSTNKPAGGAQFTPGPWVVNTFIVNGQHKLEVLDATGANACVQANAHLIVAAPAMYEALKALLAMQIECEGLLLTIEKDYHCHQTRQARAALAQAEGK